jgi:hypothetical protein
MKKKRRVKYEDDMHWRCVHTSFAMCVWREREIPTLYYFIVQVCGGNN